MITMQTLALAMALLAQDPPKKEAFVYDEWRAWSAFATGAIVEHRMESSSGTATLRRTIKLKADDMITLEVVRTIKVHGGEETTTTEKEYVKKPAEGTAAADKPCWNCEKQHPKDVKEGSTKLKIGKDDVECVLLEQTVVDCEGKKIGRLARWYSKDVPGWMVKTETVVEESSTVTRCTMFAKP